jgi:hypothetical protein
MRIIQRPTILSVVCIISFAYAVLGFPTIFSPFIKKQGDFFPAFTGILISLEFIAVVGVWYMKKWGVQMYLITAILNQSLLIYIDNWLAYKVILPIVFICLSSYFYKKMDRNL